MDDLYEAVLFGDVHAARGILQSQPDRTCTFFLARMFLNSARTLGPEETSLDMLRLVFFDFIHPSMFEWMRDSEIRMYYDLT